MIMRGTLHICLYTINFFGEEFGVADILFELKFCSQVGVIDSDSFKV